MRQLCWSGQPGQARGARPRLDDPTPCQTHAARQQQPALAPLGWCPSGRSRGPAV